MPVAAWAVPTLIGAGVSLYGTHKQASAAKEAAGQQVASAEKARADLEPIHRENVKRLDPYAQLGAQAVGSLGSLMGYPAAAPPTGYAPSGQPLGPINGQQGPMNMSDPRVQHLAKGGSLVDMDTSPGGGMQTAVTRSTSAYSPTTLASLGGGARSSGASFGGPQTVRLQAPDGEVREFPASMAQQLEAQFSAQGLRRV